MKTSIHWTGKELAALRAGSRILLGRSNDAVKQQAVRMRKRKKAAEWNGPLWPSLAHEIAECQAEYGIPYTSRLWRKAA